jgi:predicted heme/steroid binding protein
MMPPDGVFTLESLKKFNGKELPMCLALCGKVVNVSSSLNFTPDAGYGKLWAGSETTYSMAKVSLKPEDANKLDFNLNDFSDQERTALAGWYKHFTTKYPAIGTLKELDDRDFSTVFKEAETQTPFGVGKTESTEVAAKLEAEPPAAKPEVAPEANKPKVDDVVAEKEELVVPDGGVVLRRGMRVTISGLEQRTELNGSMAILEDYVPDKMRFAVKLESTDEIVLMKPASLKPAAP